MAQFTSAYSRFVKRLDEVNTLQRLARRSSLAAPTPGAFSQVDALCRAGVVLLSSHIEGFIEDLAAVILYRIHPSSMPKANLGKPFKFHLSRDLIHKIKSGNKPDKVVDGIEELLSRDMHIWDANPIFTEPLDSSPFIDDFANPKHNRINNLFQRFDFQGFEQELEIRLAADFVPCCNMVDQVVDQRNKIAHGDMIATGTPRDLANMIQYAKQYCRETDRVVGDWFKYKGCPIRQ